MTKVKPKSNDGRRVPHYSVDEAVRMLPYIKSYCRDIEKVYFKIETLIYRYYKLDSLVTTSPAREKKRTNLMDVIELKIVGCKDRYYDWLKELVAMHCFICDPMLGLVDVPVYSKALNNVIFICVSSKSMPDSISWHRLDEGCSDCRPFEWAVDKETVVR